VPSLNQSINILVADAHDVRAGLSVAAAAATPLTVDITLAAAATYQASTQLDSFIGPAILLPLDTAVAEPYEFPLGADVIVGPACFASLDVRTAATGLERLVQLDTAVAETQTSTSSMEALIAMPRTFTACLSPTVAVTDEVGACLCVNVGCPVDSIILTPALSVIVAEARNACPLPLDVNIGIGVGQWARLDLQVLAQQRADADLSVNVKSPDLQVGAGATYNADGDEVEAILYVQDVGILHPEWVESMTATLFYRDEHDLGSLTFGCTYATGDGDVQVLWMHPPHTEDLSVRFQGVINNCGDVDFTVPVTQEGSASRVFTPQLLEGVDNVAPRTEYTPFGSTTHQLDAAPEEVDVLTTDVLLTLLAVDFLSDTEPLETGNGPIDYSGGGNRLVPSLDNDGSFVFQPVDTLAHSIDGYTIVEAGGTNLLDNSDFGTPVSSTNPVPAGWQLDASSTVTLLPELEQTGDVNAFKVRMFGSGPYVGPKSLTFARTATSAVTAGQPLTWSVLARIDPVDRTANDIPLTLVKVDTLRLICSFRDAGDVEISQQVVTFAPVDIMAEAFILLQNAVPSPPLGTVGVRVSLQVESIEESDDITLYLMAPQVEQSASATSRMVGTGPVARAHDVLRLPQADNLEFRQGSIQVDFAVSYPGTPAADACLFDTRSGGLNGFALYHLANGRLRFVVAGPSTSAALDSSVQNFGAGEAHSVVVSWDSLERSIWVDGSEDVVDVTPFTLPQVVGAWIWLFSTETGAARFAGVLTGFEVQREPHG